MNKQPLTSDRVLSLRQFKTLLKEAHREKEAALADGSLKSRFATDYYIFAIAGYTGLRISEMASLRWKDIELDEGYLTVHQGKGGKRRTVVFGSKTCCLFKELKGLSKQVRSTWNDELELFIGRRGPLTKWGIQVRFLYWRRRMGLPDTITFHSLRHFHATFLLDSGVPLASVREQLGHSNISITSTYLHFTQEAREKLVSIL